MAQDWRVRVLRCWSVENGWMSVNWGMGLEDRFRCVRCGVGKVGNGWDSLLDARERISRDGNSWSMLVIWRRVSFIRRKTEDLDTSFQVWSMPSVEVSLILAKTMDPSSFFEPNPASLFPLYLLANHPFQELNTYSSTSFLNFGNPAHIPTTDPQPSIRFRLRSSSTILPQVPLTSSTSPSQSLPLIKPSSSPATVNPATRPPSSTTTRNSPKRAC